MIKLILVFLLISINIYSQTETLNFLNISENSKIRALGGNNVSLIKNHNYFLSNPALISLSNKSISLNYLKYIIDINSSSILYSDSSKFFGNYGIGLKYFSHGKFEGYDKFGNESGSFYPKEFMISLGKSINFSNFSVGTNIKYFHSKIYNKKNSGFLVDIGTIFIPNRKRDLSFGFVVNNFGILFNKNNIEIPTTIKIGSSFKPKYMPIRFSITYIKPFSKSFEKKHDISIGLEGLVSKFINLQIGYNHILNNGFKLPNSEKLRGISYGFELLISNLNINYSRSTLNSMSTSNSISIYFNLKRV